MIFTHICTCTCNTNMYKMCLDIYSGLINDGQLVISAEKNQCGSEWST